MQQGHSNAILARWAMDALKEYERVSGGGVSHIALIPMLMASLGHLADQLLHQRQGKSKALFEGAINIYQDEART